MSRVVITGDRNWSAQEPIENIIRALPDGSVVIHGAARGADTIAALAAARRGLECEPYPAEWSRWGRLAGPIRNGQMIAAKPDIVYAFHDNLATSTGTRDCLRQAIRAGVEWRLLNSEGKLYKRSAVRRLL